MKHWIIGGTVAIAATVLLFRSRTAPEQTVPTPTTTPVAVSPTTSPAAADDPATAPEAPPRPTAPATMPAPAP